MLCSCTFGLVRQNHINQQLNSQPQLTDTLETDTLPKLLTPFELTELLRSKTKTDKRYQAKDQIPYADLFQLYAPETAWQWELLAAVCYAESKFNPNAKSRSGAMGLMQMMPKITARYEIEDPFDPEQSIAAGVRYINSLNELYSFIGNKKERIKFILASYNAGPAHIMDARRLAKKYGADPYLWYENTEYWLYCLQDSVYASDTLVHFGRFKPMQTLLYVHKALRTYDHYRNLPEFSLDTLQLDETDDPEIPDIESSDSMLIDSLSEKKYEQTIIQDIDSGNSAYNTN